MSKYSTLIAFALLLTAAPSFAADSTIKADAQNINSSCSTDAATASCSGEVYGKGLLKCLHAYKKANRQFKFSDSCKSAMKQMHADRKAGK